MTEPEVSTATASYETLSVDTGVLFEAHGGPKGALFKSTASVTVFTGETWSTLPIEAPHFIVATPDGFEILAPTGPTYSIREGAMKSGPVANGGPPERLNGACLTWDATNGRALLFGGSYFDKGKTKEESTVWWFQGGKWQAVKTTGKVIGRTGAGAAWVPPLDALVVLGGFSERKGNLRETLHLTGKQWTVFETVPAPAAMNRGVAFVAWDSRGAQLTAGCPGEGSTLHLYRYLGNGAWEPFGVVTGVYQPRAAYDARERQLVIPLGSENPARATIALVPIGAWIDALSPVSWSAESSEAAPPGTTSPAAARKASEPVPTSRYLRFREDGADKFWFAERDGATYTLRWGRRGTAGQSKAFTLPSQEKAIAELTKKILAKIETGYEDAPEGRAASEIPGRAAFAMRFDGKPAGNGDRIFGAPPFSLSAWPACTSGHPMAHLATLHAHVERLPLSKHAAVAVFQCEHPGCNAWEPGGGANAVLGISAAASKGPPTPAPAQIEATEAMAIEYAIAVCENDPADDEGREEESPGGSKLGGYPTWVQGAPEASALTCAACAKPLRFLGQLDAGDTGMNFGDVGVGYVFFCPDECEGRFLSQGS